MPRIQHGESKSWKNLRSISTSTHFMSCWKYRKDNFAWDIRLKQTTSDSRTELRDVTAHKTESSWPAITSRPKFARHQYLMPRMRSCCCLFYIHNLHTLLSQFFQQICSRKKKRSKCTAGLFPFGAQSSFSFYFFINRLSLFILAASPTRLDHLYVSFGSQERNAPWTSPFSVDSTP